MTSTTIPDSWEGLPQDQLGPQHWPGHSLVTHMIRSAGNEGGARAALSLQGQLEGGLAAKEACEGV